MKKSRRKLIVDGNEYFWWYRISAGLCVVTVSPFEDRTSKVRIEFKNVESDCDYIYCFTFPLYVELEKDRKKLRIKLIEPEMATLFDNAFVPKEIVQNAKRNYITWI